MKKLTAIFLAAGCLVLGHATAPAQTGLQFNGSSQYVTFGTAAALGSSTFTIEAWVKRTATGVTTTTGTGGIDAVPVVTKGRGEGETPANLNMNYFLGLTTAGILAADFEDKATGLNHPVTGTTALSNNIWYHIAATYDGTTWRLYLNGQLDKQLAVGAFLPENTSIQHAALGTAMTSTGAAAGYFAGVIDEVRIWNYARTDQQIADAMLQQLTSGTGLLSRWGVNDGSGATVTNSVITGPPGTRTNSPTWVPGILPSLVAYNDFNSSAGDANAAYVSKHTYSTTNGALKDSTTAFNFPYTATGALQGSPPGPGGSGSGGQCNAGTDAARAFGATGSAIVDLANMNEITATGQAETVTFNNLDPNRKYTVTLTTNRNDVTYAGARFTKVTIQGADAYINASSSGVVVNSAASVSFSTGYNTINGYVAKWTGVTTGPDGSFSVKSEWDNLQGSGTQNTKAYAMSAFRLQEELPVFAQPPAAPSGLSATTISHAQMHLAWTDNSTDETSFEVERSTTGIGGTYTVLSTMPANTQSYDDLNLNSSTEYCYRVRAKNAGGPSGYAGPTAQTTPAEGSYAFDFGSGNAYVTFGNATPLALAQFTIETWFKREGTGSTTNTGNGGMLAIPLITKGRGEAEGSNVDMNYFLGIRETDNVLAADFEEGPGGPGPLGQNHPVYGSTAISNNVWNHAAATFDGTSWKLYLNGNLEATLNTSGATPRSDCIQHSALATGLTSTGASEGHFDGVLDEARIWNVARSQTEIRSAINSQLTSAQSGLVARWGLNEGSGTIVNGGAGTVVAGVITGTGSAWVTPGAPFNWTPPVQRILTMNVAGSGSVTKNPDKATYDDGEVVQITAIPASGWGFDSWSGDKTGSTNPTTITMSGGNKSVTATFVQLQLSWSAYNDCAYTTSGQTIGANVTQFGIGNGFSGSTSGILLKQSTGASTGITATLTQSGTVNWTVATDGTAGANSAPGTDAYNTFNGFAHMLGMIRYSDVQNTLWYVDLTFTGLDPAKQYAFVTTAVRNNATYTTRKSIFTITTTGSYANSSTNGVDVMAPNKVRFNTGDNYSLGYVARWTGITAPGGTFTVRAEPDPGSLDNGLYKGYAFSVFMLQEYAPPVAPPDHPPTALSATPTIGTQINLSWTDNSSNEANFAIERSTDGGTVFNPLATVGAGITTYMDAGLSAATTYFYRVRATNTGGNSDWAVSASATTSGNPNNALRLGSNTSAYVTFGNATALRLAQFTIETWFKREGTGTTTNTGTGGVYAYPLLTKGRGEAEGSNVDMNYFLGIHETDNLLAADFEEGPGGPGPLGQNHPVLGTTPIVNNVWNHAAATFDGTSWKVYLNGNLETTLSTNGATPRSDCIQHAALASGLNSTGVSEGHFDGLVDEARIWNYARTQSEIQSTMGLQVSSATGLVARWGLDEGISTTAHSSAGQTIDGTVIGTGWSWTAGAPMTIDQPPAQPVLVAPGNSSAGVSTSSASLQVSVSDPEASNLTVAFYGRPKQPTVGPDFTVVALPDAQFYTSNASGGTPAMFTAQTQWCVDNKAAKNIVFVTQLGDITNENGLTAWGNASTSMGILESPAPGIPYGIAIGNHDQLTPPSHFDTYFGESRFTGRSYYGGHYGSDNVNNFELFSASGLDFIIIHMGAGDQTPSAAVLNWANGLLQSNSSRRAIVVDHYVLETGNPANFSTPGQAIYNALKGNANLFMMLCGHVDGEGRRSDVGTSGNTVYSMLSDYQGRTNGGNGWMRIMTFSPANNKIYVKTYSPTLAQFEADADSSSQFTLSYPMQGGSSFSLLGTNTSVTSGSTTSLAWPSLANATEYEWYTTVSDGNTTITSPTWTFTTEAAPVGGVVHATQAQTNYTDPSTGVTLNFATLPAAGDVTITRRNSPPASPPAYAIPPGDASYLPLSLEISSTIPDNTFAVTVTLDVSAVAGFGPASAIMFYSGATSSWVPFEGAYAAGPPSTFTFTTTHFTPFAFVTTPATSNKLFIGNSGTAAGSCVITPDNSWRQSAPPEGFYHGPDDWSWTGSQGVNLYLVPQANAVFKSADITLEWDKSVMTYGSTLFDGISFTSSVATLAQPDQNRLRIQVSAPGDITATSYIAKLNFTLLKPGHTAVCVVGSTFEKDPAASVFVTPYQAEVKAYLGDVASPGNVLSTGDGKVDFDDLAAWSGSYWSGVDAGLDNYKVKFDFGPTEGGYVFGSPLPDTKIDFEDLVVFSIGYGLQANHRVPKIAAPPKDTMDVLLGVPVIAEGETRIPVLLGGAVSDVRALKLEISGQFAAFLGATKGTLLESYATPIIMQRTDGRKVSVDLAVAGFDVHGIGTKGDVVWLRFTGDPRVQLSTVEARTSQNAVLRVVKKAGAGESVPTSYRLEQNYPNPFNPTTTIPYALPVAGDVRIDVYNILGERVATLVNAVQDAGFYDLQWNGRDGNNRQAASGVYLYRVQVRPLDSAGGTGQFNDVKKMMLLK